MQSWIVLALIGLHFSAAVGADLGKLCQNSLLPRVSFRSTAAPALVRDQCYSGTCWIHRELSLIEAVAQQTVVAARSQGSSGSRLFSAKEPMALVTFDADYLAYHFLRTKALRALAQADSDDAVMIDIGGDFEDFRDLVRAHGLIPAGVWPHADVAKVDLSESRLMIELGWKVSMLREEMAGHEITQQDAEAKIEELLSKYFGSVPPEKFEQGGQTWTPLDFGRQFTSIALDFDLKKIDLPARYGSEREMKQMQLAVAAQLRKTGLPVRADVRWLDCFADFKTGLLSVERFSQVEICPTWINQLTSGGHDSDYHAILITGYAFVDGKLQFEYLNSWGPTFGSNGRGTLDFSYWSFVRTVFLKTEFARILRKDRSNTQRGLE